MSGDTPELEQNDHPAYVVVFSGPVDLPVFGGPPHDGSTPGPDGGFIRSYTGVVCVVVDDRAIVYHDVDTTEVRAP